MKTINPTNNTFFISIAVLALTVMSFLTGSVGNQPWRARKNAIQPAVGSPATQFAGGFPIPAVLEPQRKLDKSVVSDTVSDLLALPLSDGQSCLTLGRVTKLDGGANRYVYHSTGRPKSEDGGFTIFGLKTNDWLEASDKSVANAHQFGAFGLGVLDELVPLQNCLNARNSSGCEVLIPSGRYRVTDTLDFGRFRSSVIRGQGNATSPLGKVELSQPNKRGGTVIVYDGKADGVLATTTSQNLAIYDITFYGSDKAESSFLVNKGIGQSSGHINFHNVTLPTPPLVLNAATI